MDEDIRQRLKELLGKYTIVYRDKIAGSLTIEPGDPSELSLTTLLKIRDIVRSNAVVVSISGSYDDTPALVIDVGDE